jgi:hypothetical protein
VEGLMNDEFEKDVEGNTCGPFKGIISAVT